MRVCLSLRCSLDSSVYFFPCRRVDVTVTLSDYCPTNANCQNGTVVVPPDASTVIGDNTTNSSYDNVVVSPGAIIDINNPNVTITGSFDLQSNSSLEVSGNSSVIIGGNFSMGDSNVALTDGSNVTVAGCVKFGGNLSLFIPLSYADSTVKNISVMRYACREGEFDKVVLKTSEECAVVTMVSSPSYLDSQLIITFGVDRTRCQEDRTYVYIIVAVALFLLIVAAILMVAVKPLRKKIFPFRDRKHHQMMKD